MLAHIKSLQWLVEWYIDTGTFWGLVAQCCPMWSGPTGQLLKKLKVHAAQCYLIGILFTLWELYCISEPGKTFTGNRKKRSEEYNVIESWVRWCWQWPWWQWRQWWWCWRWCWWCWQWPLWQQRWWWWCWRWCWWASSQTWVYTSAGRPSKVNEERKLAGKKQD